MNQPQIQSMLNSIDIFYDKKQKLYQQLDKGSISFSAYREQDKELDKEFDALMSKSDYNENEQYTVHELKVFANKQ
jgi:hypothetical protein